MAHTIFLDANTLLLWLQSDRVPEFCMESNNLWMVVYLNSNYC
jgi:hypothetical protein